MAELYQLPNNRKNWFAVYTRPRWEKKVREALGRKQLHCFCPMQMVQKQWSDRKKIIEEPLFRSYIFVHIAGNEFHRVLTTEGILNFVYYDGKPAIIRQSEIDMIQSFLGIKDVVISCQPLPVFNPDERVKVAHGIFMDSVGTVMNSNKKRVVVKLDSLQQMMIVEFSNSHLERVACC